MALPLETDSEFGQRVLKRLETEPVVWLTVVNGKGEPAPTMVWFYWDGERVLLFTKPGGKVTAIRATPHVALNFNGTPDGGDMVILNGTARILEESSRNALPAEFFAKYRQGIASLGYTDDSIALDYRIAIAIEIERIRGF